MAMSIDKLMDIVLGVFVFAALIGTIATSVVGAAAGNVTGAAATLLGLTTLLLVIVFIKSIVKSGKGR